MPTSTKSKTAKDFFVLKNNRREDAKLHEDILANGDDGQAKNVSRAVMRRLKIDPKRIESLLGKSEKS
jgi:hypothetical protein